MDTVIPPGVLPPLPGDPPAIGPYPVLGRLGIGGMGVVYLARGPSGELVAVKTLRVSVADNDEARSRLRAEIVYGRRVTSCWTPEVLADGTDHTRPYVVTEYIPGPSLSQWVLTQGPLEGDALDAVALGTAAALADIHQAGLVHRDLKPANVLLSHGGPRVIDFGIANDLEVPGGFTQQGMVIGSPGWVSPERLEGGPATPASDVFGWGCVAAFAALGRHPFGTGQPSEVLYGYPELSGLEEPLRGLVLLALAHDAATRPPATELVRLLLHSREQTTAAEAVAALWAPVLPVIHEVPDAATSPSPTKPRTAPGRFMWPIAAAGVGMVAAIVALAGAASKTPDAPWADGPGGGGANPSAGHGGTHSQRSVVLPIGPLAGGPRPSGTTSPPPSKAPPTSPTQSPSPSVTVSPTPATTSPVPTVTDPVPPDHRHGHPHPGKTQDPGNGGPGGSDVNGGGGSGQDQKPGH